VAAYRGEGFRCIDSLAGQADKLHNLSGEMAMIPPTFNAERSDARTKIIVINMVDAVERRDRFEKRARHAPLPWSFYPAHTSLHAALTYDEQGAIIAKGRPLRAGELGAYSSHYAAWQDLQSDAADQYVVLEDDVIVDWNFLDKLARINLAKMGINYLRLCYTYPTRRPALVMENVIDGKHSIVELDGTVFGAMAYAITKAGARVFLDHCRIVRRPIDDEMDRSWAHGQRNLSVFPFPVIGESGESTIGVTRFDAFVIPRELRFKRLVARRLELWQRDASTMIRRFQRFRERLAAGTKPGE
jgi:glycosyl transferase family 25